MDIHKPKPWHGFRDFLKEYVIIVVGVLTALGGEQVVENLHWRHQTQLAHEALAYDMKRVMAWSALTDAQGPCVDARLTELDALLDKAQESGRFGPLGPVGKLREGAWYVRAWSGLTYGQTLAHMPNGEQTKLAALARMVEGMNDWDSQSVDDWARLQRMSGAGRRTNDAEIAALRETIARERGLAMKLRRGARQAQTLVLQLGLLSKDDAEKAWKQGMDDVANAALCRAIPPVSELDLNRRYLRLPAAPFGSQDLDTIGVQGESLR